MKRLNYLVLIFASAAAVSMGPRAQAGESLVGAKTPKDRALFSSPRYLEDHPELLRAPLAREGPSTLQKDRLAALTENTALANSPRFREEHPELRWTIPSGGPSVVQTASESERLKKLTENTALANSPRFLEEHPELLRRESGFEIAPLK